MNYPQQWHGPAPAPSDLHETAGLPGNWALDFMAPGGTRVLAPESGYVSRYSGHPPSEGVIGGDIFGWNIYLTLPDGSYYFFTHLGNRAALLHQHVDAATILGHVGHWPGDEPRSHTHLGFTSIHGEQASKDHICEVARAPRVDGHWHP